MQLRVDFADVEWEHWVLAPTSFETHYCLGRCAEFGGLGPEVGDGAAVYAELMRRRGPGLGLSPCCAPTAFAPLTVTVLLSPNEEVQSSPFLTSSQSLPNLSLPRSPRRCQTSSSKAVDASKQAIPHSFVTSLHV